MGLLLVNLCYKDPRNNIIQLCVMSIHMPHTANSPITNSKEYSDDEYLQCIDDIVKNLDKNTVSVIFGELVRLNILVYIFRRHYLDDIANKTGYDT